MEARSRNFHTGIRGIKLHAQLASQVAGCELVDGSKLVEGSRLVEGFNDGCNNGNELVEGSIDDDGTSGLLRAAPMMASMTAPSSFH